jgi:hypothetical protein
MERLRIYADTSIFGGVFDPEFEKMSRTFFEQVRQGEYDLIISPLVDEELMNAPEFISDFYQEMFPYLGIVNITSDALELQSSYIEHKILTPKWKIDALHVAIATVNKCQIITSWNFKHIVHFQKIKLYNAVNLLCGYPPISIHSPNEVLRYEID